MTSPTHGGRRAHFTTPIRLLLIGLLVALVAAACGDDDTGTDAADGDAEPTTVQTLRIGGIPDQDPDRLQRQFGLVADHLAEELGIEVEYVPVAEYDAAVSAFRVGDLDLVWFGGLTGVQARLQVDGAEAIAQRDIDAEFTSIFIARADTGIDPFDDVAGLTALADTRFTFGSDSSTSGRLMPQSFLAEAGVTLDDFDGEAGFSGSHDATIELVESGSFETGALNSQVWRSRVEEGTVDTDAVVAVFESPTYPDYHWVVRPELGDELVQAIQDALFALDADDPDDAAILELFGAGSFIEASSDDYGAIEEVGREIGRIED